jgi:hypothetical protein
MSWFLAEGVLVDVGQLFLELLFVQEVSSKNLHHFTDFASSCRKHPFTP